MTTWSNRLWWYCTPSVATTTYYPISTSYATTSLLKTEILIWEPGCLQYVTLSLPNTAITMAVPSLKNPMRNRNLYCNEYLAMFHPLIYFMLTTSVGFSTFISIRSLLFRLYSVIELFCTFCLYFVKSLDIYVSVTEGVKFFGINICTPFLRVIVPIQLSLLQPQL